MHSHMHKPSEFLEQILLLFRVAFTIALKKLHPHTQSYVHFNHVHLITESCSKTCYSKHFCQIRNLTHLHSLSSLLLSLSPQLNFSTPHLMQLMVCLCLTSVKIKSVWKTVLLVLLLQNQHC